MMTSIIIPTRGRSGLLLRCIERIKETATGDYEIIVVDDCSHPPLTNEDPDVRLVTSTKHVGPGGARNLGAMHAKGDLFLFVDSDVVLSERTFQIIIEQLQLKTHGAVQGMFEAQSPHKDFFSNYKNLYWNYNQGQMNPESYSVCTAIFAIFRNVFQQVNGFNETSFIGEDREMGQLLQKNKIRVYQLKDAQGAHYKKFEFWQLIKYVFQNGVISALLILKMRHDPGEDRTGGGGKKQMMGILLSPFLVLFSVAALVAPQPILWVATISIWAFSWYVSANFLRYVIKQKGLSFAVLSFFMYLIEGLAAFVGLMWGVVRYLILQRRELNFGFGSGT
jgi:glycosyltransferase involved in cell wall biosynthesis